MTSYYFSELAEMNSGNVFFFLVFRHAHLYKSNSNVTFAVQSSWTAAITWDDGKSFTFRSVFPFFVVYVLDTDINKKKKWWSISHCKPSTNCFIFLSIILMMRSG